MQKLSYEIYNKHREKSLAMYEFFLINTKYLMHEISITLSFPRTKQKGISLRAPVGAMFSSYHCTP